MTDRILECDVDGFRVPASWDEALEALLRGEPGPVLLGPPVPIAGKAVRPFDLVLDGGAEQIQVLEIPWQPAGMPAGRARHGNQRDPHVGHGHPVGQVRGVLAQEVVVSTPLDPFLPLKAIAAYGGCSIRWLRDRLTDPHHPLPCYRVPGGKILVRRSEFDAWMARYRQVGDPDVERVISDALNGLRQSPTGQGYAP